MFSLDLSDSFPVETVLSQNFIQSITIPPNVVPNLINQSEELYNGALFATNDTFYVFGGADPTQNLLASYNAISETWASVSVSGSDFLTNPRYQGQSVSDPFTGLSFYSGGTDNIYGMVKFDASNPAAVSWTNETSVSPGDGDPSPNRFLGGMVYLPKGKAGVLLLLGGYFVLLLDRIYHETTLIQIQPNVDPLEWFSFEWIDIYDIESNTWLASGVDP